MGGVAYPRSGLDRRGVGAVRDMVLAAATAALLAAVSLAAAPPSPGQGQAQGLALTAGTRSATLSCDGIAHGTHPLPLPACTALSAADGDFDALLGQPAVCREPYAPITAGRLPGAVRSDHRHRPG
ncbi:SSI family serine proteinase inhibitor [Actinacidiphila bryophytorum]|nr:SSI family serine proteinase inhibitor [Actinacidiphila bryophytorum]